MVKRSRGAALSGRRLCSNQIGVLIVANSPSQRWENGVLVERAIETNRWAVLPDGTPVGDTAEEEAEVGTKAVVPAEAEDKSVKRAAKK
jgi:hypothetical protein